MTPCARHRWNKVYEKICTRYNLGGGGFECLVLTMADSDMRRGKPVERRLRCAVRAMSRLGNIGAKP